MTALALTTDKLKHLPTVERMIDDALARGETAWRDLAQAVAAVYHNELWKDAKVPSGPVDEGESRLHVPRACKSFAEWCEVCREKTPKWGYNLVSAAAFCTVVQNERQARELSGLSEQDARTLVELATESGTKQTTAEELRRLRASDAIAKTQEGKQQAKKTLRGLEQRDWIGRVEAKANSLRKVLRQEVGTEKAEGLLDKCVNECRELAA